MVVFMVTLYLRVSMRRSTEFSALRSLFRSVTAGAIVLATILSCSDSTSPTKGLDGVIHENVTWLGPDLSPAQKDALAKAVTGRVRPEYTAEQYGQPAYLQLHLNGPNEIATGAEDGSEQGVFCHLKQPQREANLRLRLEEYLPFGLEPGLIYVN